MMGVFVRSSSTSSRERELHCGSRVFPKVQQQKKSICEHLLQKKVCNTRTCVTFRRTWESAGVRVWFRFLSFFHAVCVEVDRCATLFAWYCDLLAVEAPSVVKAQTFVPN